MNAINILLSSSDISLKDLSKKHLLIDTNFLIDAFRFPTQFKLLIESLKNDFTLVSIEATLVEFTKGSKSIVDFSKKVNYYSKIIQITLPLDMQIHNNVANIIKVLLKKGGQLNYVDCLLLGTTMKYKDSLYLFTKDRSDVPISLFNTVATVIVETADNNCAFSIYEFNEETYKNMLIQRVQETQD